MKKNKKNPLAKSFYYAFVGIITCIKEERNMLIHFLITILVIIAGFVFKISLNEWIICIGLFGLVMSLELVNTAIEATVDICSPAINKKAKIAKDCAAGAVLISAIAALIIGLLIFIPKIIQFF